MIRLNRYIAGLLLILGSTLTISAQNTDTGDDSSTEEYNPDNPTEPGNVDKLSYYKVETVIGTEGAGTVSGGGKYKYGTSITVKATAVTGYNFAYWLKDDETTAYSTSSSFTYTVTGAVKFTAVYLRVKSVYAYVSDAAAGTATATRQVVSGQNQAVLKATENTDYHFRYWLKDDGTEPYSTDNPYTYDIQDEDWEVRFTAVYEYVYNPDSPGEPTNVDQLVKHKVNVSLNDSRAGAVSGAGSYKYGTSVTISTSGAVGFEFKRWLLDGQPYCTSKSFTYTVGTTDVNFVAEYVNTAEELEEKGHALYLTTNQEGSCIFNVESGTRYMPGDTYSVTVVPSQDQTFDGWYIGTSLVGVSITYSSTMGDEDVTLSAHFTYNPGNPDAPTNPGAYIDYGDVNDDKVVDIEDLILLVDYLKTTPTTTTINLKNADANKDGKVTIDDVNAVKKLVLKGKTYSS